MDIPDMSGVQAYLFDGNWKLLSKDMFPTGYRLYLKEATLNRDNPLRQPLLVVRLTPTGPFIIVQGERKRPAFEQGDFQREYYALLAGHLALVRLEDDQGHAIHNRYDWSAPAKGPPPPRRTREEWVRSLSSADPVEQLATLVWLSGHHLPSAKPPDVNVSQESVEDARLWEAVRADPETARALQGLAQSENPWVREYARLATSEKE